MTAIKEFDDVWLNDDVLGTVLSVSRPYVCGNLTDADGTSPRGREYVVFVPEEE